jgi:hypothetical protein
MRRQYRKYAIWGAAFAVLITLGAATAAFTAGAAPFRADDDHDDDSGHFDGRLDDGLDVHRHDVHRDDDHGERWRWWRRDRAGRDAHEGRAEVHRVAVGDSSSS